MAKSRWASCPWYVSTRSLAFGAIWTTYRVFGGFAAVVFILALIGKLPLFPTIVLALVSALYAAVCHAVYNSVKH